MQEVTKILDWVSSPVQDSTTIQFWVIGLVAILVLSFLWATVVKEI